MFNQAQIVNYDIKFLLFYINISKMKYQIRVFFSRKNVSSDLKSLSDNMYVGRQISSDNGLISQKLLLKSELYYPLHVTMGVAYSCLKYGVFIITLFDAIQICKQHGTKITF